MMSKLFKATYGVLFTLSICIGSCKSEHEPKSTNEKKTIIDTENFNDFYESFHKDSLFQMKRILFPLPGINTDEMTVDDTTYYWQEREWEMHHRIDTTQYNYEREVSDTLVIEKVYSDDPGFIFKREFKNISGKWFLTYYESINL